MELKLKKFKLTSFKSESILLFVRQEQEWKSLSPSPHHAQLNQVGWIKCMFGKISLKKTIQICHQNKFILQTEVGSSQIENQT